LRKSSCTSKFFISIVLVLTLFALKNLLWVNILEGSSVLQRDINNENKNKNQDIREITSFFKKRNNASYNSILCFNKGVFHIKESSAEEVLRGVKEFKNSLKHYPTPEAYALLGYCYASDWKIKDAFLSYKKALRLYRMYLKKNKLSANLKGEALVLKKIAELYGAKGKYIKALECLEKSLKIYTATGDDSAQGDLLEIIGNVHCVWGKYEKALEYMRRSFKIYSNIGNGYKKTHVLNDIGFVYKSLGKYAEALDYYKKSLDISSEIGSLKRKERALSNIGEIYHAYGEYNKAIEYYKQSLKINTETGNYKGYEKVLNTIEALHKAKMGF